MSVKISGYEVVIVDQHTIQVYAEDSSVCLAQVCGTHIRIEDQTLFDENDLIVLLAQLPIKIHMEAL